MKTEEILLKNNSDTAVPPPGYKILRVRKSGEIVVHHRDGTKTSTLTAPLSVYAAGTAYALTATSAALDFGTTDPSLVINAAGTWLIQGRVNLKYTGATFAANRTVTLKLRRTNNTAADLTNGSTAIITGVVTTITETLAVVTIPPTVYTTTRTDDAITIFADVSVLPSAGTLDVTEASIIAIR